MGPLVGCAGPAYIYEWDGLWDFGDVEDELLCLANGGRRGRRGG